MAIGSVVQRGAWVVVYDERGRQLCSLIVDSRSGDSLQGYTGATVSIRRGGWIMTYDETGRKISMTTAR